MTALTPDRVYAAAARRAATPLPNGWQRPPPRPIPEFRPVRGLLHCGSASCRAAGVTFVHRDVNAAVNILNNAVSLGAGTGMLTWMDREVQHNDPPRSGPGAPRFRLRVEDRQGGGAPGARRWDVSEAGGGAPPPPHFFHGLPNTLGNGR